MAGASLTDRIFGTWTRTDGAEIQLPRKIPLRIEPKSYFANERTFLSWAHMATTLGGITAVLAGYTYSDTATGPGAQGPISRTTSELVSLIMLPLAALIISYALFTYLSRSFSMHSKQVGYFDDKMGPITLCCLIIVALVAINVLAVWDVVVSQ